MKLKKLPEDQKNYIVWAFVDAFQTSTQIIATFAPLGVRLTPVDINRIVAASGRHRPKNEYIEGYGIVYGSRLHRIWSDIEQVVQDYDEGWRLDFLAAGYGCSVSTLHKLLRNTWLRGTLRVNRYRTIDLIE